MFINELLMVALADTFPLINGQLGASLWMESPSELKEEQLPTKSLVKDESLQLMIKKNEMTIGGLKTLHSNDQKCCLSHPLVAQLLVVIFGISAWIGVNGIYVQLPLLVISAPEGWNLAAFLVVVVQAANVGPATYTLARKFCRPNESLSIFVLLFTGSLAMGVLAFYYDQTSYLNGSNYSVTLFVCGFFTALVGCSSSVLFMPYLRNSTERYLVFYFIGEGLSGVLPSVAALLQGVGGNPECVNYGNGTTVEVSPEPRFSPRDYFIFIFAILLLSLCTFKLLQYIPSVHSNDSPRVGTKSFPDWTANDSKSESHESNPHTEIIINNGCKRSNRDISKTEQLPHTKDLNIPRTVYLYILVGLVCFLGNGFLPGIQTYSCLPYGNVAFHLTVTLANIANPAACLLYLWIDSINLRSLDVLTFVGAITCTYAIYLAAMSPIPPLRDSALGIILAVLAWVILTGTISYLKLSITSMVRQRLGPGALFGLGIAMQLGSACGALLSFGLINYTALFQQQILCTPL